MNRRLFVCNGVWIIFIVGIFSWGFLNLGVVQSQIPQKINFQGKLTNTVGLPVPDGQYEMKFELYDGGGASVWGAESWTASTRKVEIANGLFEVLLGTYEPLAAVGFDETYWLEIQVYDRQSSSWEIFTPRKPLASVPYALRAEKIADGSDVHFNNVIADGNVGIGTTIPASKLDISGDIAIGGSRVIDSTGAWVGNPAGLLPSHQWSGTSLRFQNPDGSWGSYVNLQGPAGPQGPAGAQGATGPQGPPGPDWECHDYTVSRVGDHGCSSASQCQCGGSWRRVRCDDASQGDHCFFTCCAP